MMHLLLLRLSLLALICRINHLMATDLLTTRNHTYDNRIIHHRRSLFTINNNNKDNIKPEINIVIHDSIKGYLNWMQEWFVDAALTRCATTRCKLIDDKSKINIADVVLYHAPTHNQMGTNAQLNSNRPLKVLISLEQPKYAKILSNPAALQQFDLIATYSLQSLYPGTKIPNLPLTYYPLHILSTDVILQQPRPFKDKTGYGTGVSVALFTSNCHAAGAGGRYKYVEDLMKLIPVHSYGKCHNNRQEPDMPNDPAWPPIAQRRARKVKVLSHYKFYLAFENLAVDDYVSEKVYEGLFAGTVSVYRGASSIDLYMPSNDSYINANHMSPKELAAKLEYLANNEAEYNKLFEFKKQPVSQRFNEMALLSYTHPNVLCRICERGMAFKKSPKKIFPV